MPFPRLASLASNDTHSGAQAVTQFGMTLARDPLEPLHVLPQRLGNHDTAVALLIVLQNRNDRAAERQARAVERVYEACPFLRGAIADVRAPRLEIEEVRARRDLAICLLPGQPNLEVVRFRAGEPEVAGRQRHAPVGKIERLENRFGVARQALVLVPGAVRHSELYDLDLLELMQADHAARVFAVRSGFAAKTRRIRAKRYRER